MWEQKDLYRFIGEVIRKKRSQAGLTQRALAEKLGCEQSVIARIETGVRALKWHEVQAICHTLQLPVADISPYPEPEALEQ